MLAAVLVTLTREDKGNYRKEGFVWGLEGVDTVHQDKKDTKQQVTLHLDSGSRDRKISGGTQLAASFSLFPISMG